MVTNTEVRDRLIKCFIDAHEEFMKKSAEITGKDSSAEKVRERTYHLMELAFKQIGADIDNPKKEDFYKVIDILKRQAKIAGRSDDIIKKHEEEIKSLIEQLDE